MKRWIGAAVLLTIGLLALSPVAASAQTIELPRPVPAFSQAYTEGPNAWGNCGLGTVGCPDQICTTGCLVTAFSSVLAYYQISLSVSAEGSCTGEARTGMDPGIFNDWLRQQGGYGRCSQDPAGNCCLIWEQLPAGLEITTHVNRSEAGLSPVSSVVIDHALRQGYPVVAGVHWGSYCSGSSGQSEDCHWVVITGKRDGAYTIMDPYNPDPTSPYGVRTTLAAGVHGSYIVDRFVVVEGKEHPEMGLQLTAEPQGLVYQVGQRIRLTLSTADDSTAVLPFARVTTPAGLVAYAVLDEKAKDGIRYSTSRSSLIPDPRSLAGGWTWYDTMLDTADVGNWTWEVWTELPDAPGTRLERRIFSYDVVPAEGSVGATLLGVLLVVGIAAVAFWFVLRSGAP